jgi:hypothetical protein
MTCCSYRFAVYLATRAPQRRHWPGAACLPGPAAALTAVLPAAVPRHREVHPAAEYTVGVLSRVDVSMGTYAFRHDICCSGAAVLAI